MSAVSKDPKVGAPKLDQPQLQAGGGTASAYNKASIVETLSPLFTKYIQTVHDELEKQYKFGAREGQLRWLAEEQQRRMWNYSKAAQSPTSMITFFQARPMS
jgi:hypothetical protein